LIAEAIPNFSATFRVYSEIVDSVIIKYLIIIIKIIFITYYFYHGNKYIFDIFNIILLINEKTRINEQCDKNNRIR